MSYIVTECAWCGETYSFGVVGVTQIGTGHECKVTHPCASRGCCHPAVVRVAGWRDPDDKQFVCLEHARGVILEWQMKPACADVALDDNQERR